MCRVEVDSDDAVVRSEAGRGQWQRLVEVY